MVILPTASDSINEEHVCCASSWINCLLSTTFQLMVRIFLVRKVERRNSQPLKVTPVPVTGETAAALRVKRTSWWLLPRPITTCTSGLFPPFSKWKVTKSLTSHSLLFADTRTTSTWSATIAKVILKLLLVQERWLNYGRPLPSDEVHQHRIKLKIHFFLQ